MLQDMNNKDTGNFTFIQEQIASKRKSRLKRMLFSFAWTLVLGCTFGVVAAFVFCISQPSIDKLVGKEDPKKEIEFPTSGVLEGEDDQTQVQGNISQSPSSNSEDVEVVQSTITPTPIEEEEEKEPETVIVEQRVDGNLEDLQNIYGELKSISNSYVRSLVTVTGITSDVDWHNLEIDYSTVTTGLLIAENGADVLILLNYDKIADAKRIEVTLWEGSTFEGRVQAYDDTLNIAILAVSMNNLTKDQLSGLKYAELGESYNITLGQPILALGSPNGYVGSMGFGIISNKLSTKYIVDGKIDLFHTDLVSNENSEGIIVDLEGTVIGIITQSLKDNSNHNVTTAVGISKIKRVIQSMVNENERAYFGVKAMDMPENVMKEYNVENGIYISEILPNSPALEAGLQIGDIILSADESNIISVQTFQNILYMHVPKDILKVKVLRTTKISDNELTFDVTIGKKSGS